LYQTTGFHWRTVVAYPLPIDTCSHESKALLAVHGIPSRHIPSSRSAAASQIPRVPYLAGVSATADAPRLDAFRQALRDHGYIKGQNILIETHHEGRDLDRLPEHAAEVVGQKPEVFVAVTTNAALAAKKAAAGADYAENGCLMAYGPGYSNDGKDPCSLC